MVGAQARLCAPAWIAVVLFEIVKHGCWCGRRGLQRSIGRRSSLLGDWLRGPVRLDFPGGEGRGSGRKGRPKQSLGCESSGFL
jgi:hypothetical protein